MKTEKQKFLAELKKAAKGKKFLLRYDSMIRREDGKCPLAVIGEFRTAGMWFNTSDFSARLGYSWEFVEDIMSAADRPSSRLSRSRRELRRDMRKAVGL